MNFVHLQVHSEFSVHDGLLTIKDLVNRVSDMGMPAVALTDLDNVYASVKFYQAALAKGIQPLIGAELTVRHEAMEHPFKLLALCQNHAGYQRLCALLSRDDFHASLPEKILVLDGASSDYEGLLWIVLDHPFWQKEDTTAAQNVLSHMQSLVGDRLFCGMARLDRVGEGAWHKRALSVCDKLTIPMVALGGVCFATEADFEAHEVRVCIDQGEQLDSDERDRGYTKAQWLQPAEQMVARFADVPEAISNTVRIAQMCHLTLPLGAIHLPNFPVSKGHSSLEETFRAFVQEGFAKRLQGPLATLNEEQKTAYQERLEVESQVIVEMGFCGYFLIVADFINWSKEHAIFVGPGRGSGAGSLVAYVLSITDVDPIPYGLLFERFLNPERVSMPDFDVDFCMEKRDQVIQYVTEHYGADKVSQIITFGTMAAKAVVRDVGRVLGHPYNFTDRLAKLIPMDLGITLTKAMEQEPLLAERYEREEDVRILMNLALKLEGITRQIGKHAGGVVIAPEPLPNFTALDKFPDGQLSHLDKDDLEHIGLIKFDFLGLRTLTIIDWTLQAIEHTQDKKIDISTIALDDKSTYELLCACQTTAVFQLESRGMKDLIKRLQPDRFEEIVALVALFRPGPLQSGMVDDFIDRKHGRAEASYFHDSIQSILEPTYGVILYQEQVMQIAQKLSGYSLGEADLLRRAMGKKKPEVMAKQRKIFIQGALGQGIDAELSGMLFDLIEKFAGYGFNKSHSVAYALLSYQTAWLKRHYPAAFMASVLSSDMDHTDKVTHLLQECSHMKLEIKPPSLNLGSYRFEVLDEKSIAYGLGAIKGIGQALIESLVELREQKGLYRDLLDVCMRLLPTGKLNRRSLEALIDAGAMDDLGPTRTSIRLSLDNALSQASALLKDQSTGQRSLLGGGSEQATVHTFVYTEAQDDPMRLLQGEKDALGLYLSGHPMDAYKGDFATLRIQPLARIRASKNTRIAGLIASVRFMSSKSGKPMAFVELEDGTGSMDVGVFGKAYETYRSCLVKDQLIVVEGDVVEDAWRGGLKIQAESIALFHDHCYKACQYVWLDIQKESAIRALKSVCQKAPKGRVHVLLLYQDDEDRALLKLDQSIALSDSWLQELKAIDGLQVTLKFEPLNDALMQAHFAEN